MNRSCPRKHRLITNCQSVSRLVLLTIPRDVVDQLKFVCHLYTENKSQWLAIETLHPPILCTVIAKAFKSRLMDATDAAAFCSRSPTSRHSFLHLVFRKNYLQEWPGQDGRKIYQRTTPLSPSFNAFL